ncbi:DUF421 domain-containing protein [Cereibacter changlensis]|uniref:DUF421 domain-containing protein n=1 Tax=Cereibacter changlensis TaxID=402884 RepID=UPI004033F0B7
MEDPVVPFDLARMFLGDEPPLFLLEIVFRTLVIYSYTLMLLRWVGGRSVAQLSIVEFLLVIALGSAVGDALFYPDVPLLHAMVVITVVVALDKLIDVLIRHYQPVKRIVDGVPVEIMRDGRILMPGLTERKIGPIELKEMLRLEGIENLGQVRRAYLEASGHLSVFRNDPVCPGLSIVPPFEITPPMPSVLAQPACCRNCGAWLDPATEGEPCPFCKDTNRARLSLAPQEKTREREATGTEPSDDRGSAREDQAPAAGLYARDRGGPQAE